MIKGWAKEYEDEGMLTEAKENVLETLDARFSKDVPEDVYKKVQALNNSPGMISRMLKSQLDISIHKKTWYIWLDLGCLEIFRYT